MDITRLPATTTWSKPANNLTRTQPPAAAAEVSETTASRQRRRVPAERVIQGELLQPERYAYSTTRSFLIERSLIQANPAESDTGLPHANPAAISQYLNHTRPEAVAELTQGRAVDYFV